ncbi:MAG: SUMF1/EgtB/PvdO family nonheme iron enzyme [Fuerstiella sp.]|nr:SUMF1/EgtB/PvdO family nonheme iron enzyme [Fuerstiella sp.]
MCRSPSATFTRVQGETAHEVILIGPFYPGRYELSQARFERVTGRNSSFFRGAARPVDAANRKEAVECCQKLSAIPQEQSAGRIYRSPTDAEWEYVSRAGTTTGFSFGEKPGGMGNHGWLSDHDSRCIRGACATG